MVKDLEKISRCFKLLKELHQISGEYYNMSEKCHEFKVHTKAGQILRNNGIIERVKQGRGFIYNWSSEVLPNIKMAEKLNEEIESLKGKKAPKKEPEIRRGTPEPKKDILAKYKTPVEVQELKGEILVLKKQHEKEICKVQEQCHKEVDSLKRKLDEAHQNTMKFYEQETRNHLVEPAPSTDCREYKSEFSLLWGLVKYYKFKN